MLNAHRRNLYTDALRPPPGTVFDEGVGTTFSLDLDTLLTVPLHLALFSGDRPGAALADGIKVLEALRRTSERLLVFAQQGQIHVPHGDQLLYGLLESVVVETSAPGGGVFHPKLWALRFVDPKGEGDPRYRLLILSRNITFDRSWDVCLRLEGGAGSRPAENAALRDLLRRLPGLAAKGVPSDVRARVERFGDELARVEWEVPEGFESVVFHAIGLDGKPWLPRRSAKLAVISPFIEPAALDALAKTTGEPAVLVSRQEELDRLAGDGKPPPFQAVFTLHEATETEEGEEVDEREVGLIGLHAKVYVCEDGDRTRVAVGSANATGAGLLGRGNVELLAELEGSRRSVGGVQDVLGEDGMGDVLLAYQSSAPPPEPSDEEKAAGTALEAARKALASSKLVVGCQGGGDAWNLVLSAPAPLELAGIATARAWPISLGSGHAANAAPLAGGEPVRIGPCSLASVTGLIAFELVAQAHPKQERFVLNLPLDGAPDGRFAAVTRAVLANREGFLRYLLLLLSDFGEDDGLAAMLAGAALGKGHWRSSAGFDDLPLLEHLVRALTRDSERLRTVASLVRQLESSPGGRELITEEFLKLWSSFEALMAEER